MKWIDSSTYSRLDKERKPTCWRLKGRNFLITITNGHIGHRGSWIMHCRDVGIEEFPFLDGTYSKEQAQQEAVKVVKSYLKQMMEEIDHHVERG